MVKRSDLHDVIPGAVSARTPSGSASDLQIAYLPPERLRASPRNARTHSKKQLKQIAESIERFGFVNPVLISDDCEIIAGHGRVEAAKMLGLKEVPTVRLSNLSPAERRAYVIADNRLAELAGWDRDLLASDARHDQIKEGIEELNDPLLRKLIGESAETAQVGQQHCRLEVADVASLNGASHDPRAGIAPWTGLLPRSRNDHHGSRGRSLYNLLCPYR